MTKRYLPDTNALLNQPYFLLGLEGEIHIPYTVLQELDKIKTEVGTGRGFYARQAVRMLKQMGDKIHFDVELPNGNNLLSQMNNDDKILSYAQMKNCIVITGDFLMQLKAKAMGLEVIEVDTVMNVDAHMGYTGIHEMFVDTTSHEDNLKLEAFYSDRNGFARNNMVINQYLAIWDTSKPKLDSEGKIVGYEILDTGKFNGNDLIGLQFKKLDNSFTGKVNPLNVKQRFLFDMLQNQDITVKATFGGFGVGKDFVMISHAIHQVMFNHKKIVWVRNNVEVRDSNQIGFLPNSLEDKLLPFAMPLADHVGGVEGLRRMLLGNQIEIQHLGFIRGRDIKDSIVYVTEVENNTKEHLQLLIGRISEGSQLWINGDTKQIDADKFLFNNGVNSAKKLMGQKLYGQVTLDKIERSETAQLADLLDN